MDTASNCFPYSDNNRRVSSKGRLPVRLRGLKKIEVLKTTWNRNAPFLPSIKYAIDTTS